MAPRLLGTAPGEHFLNIVATDASGERRTSAVVVQVGGDAIADVGGAVAHLKEKVILAGGGGDGPGEGARRRNGGALDGGAARRRQPIMKRLPTSG